MCGHVSGWQKWPGSEGQLNGGWPARRTIEKGL